MTAAGSHPRELLSSYLDDELTIEERSAVDRHLAVCESCRGQLSSLRALARALREEPVPDVPADLALRIGGRIDEAAVIPFRKRSRFLVPASIAATIGAVGLLVTLQWRRGELPTAVPPASPALEKSIATEAPPERKDKLDAELDTTRPLAAEPAVVPRQELDLPADPGTSVAPAFAPAPPQLASAKKAEAEEGFQRDADRPREGAAGDALVPQQGLPAPGRQPLTGAASRLSRAVSCGDRWIDTSLLGTWATGDIDRAARDLDRVARGLGGRSERVEPYPAQVALIVPRDRARHLIEALEKLGVTGLQGSLSPEEGFDCVRQRVNLEAALPR